MTYAESIAGYSTGQGSEPSAKTDKSVVYFIGCEAAIKIGKARNVKRRLGEIQALSPVRLQVFATTPGNLRLEKEYHARFADHRLHGEWFAPHPDILAEIARITAPAKEE